jgi:protein TonB
MRILYSLGFGLLVTLALFLLMNGLVSGQAKGVDSSGATQIQDFVRVSRDESIRQKERELPKKPEPPKRPPTPQQVSQNQNEQVRGPRLNLDLPRIDVPFGSGGGPFLGGGGGGGTAASFGDGDVIPIVRIEPQFPREALLNGISGYVSVSFTIMEDGSVEPGSAKVVDSKPPRLFDREALRAIARWKFKPRVIDGRPVKRPATQTINFNLQADDDKR